MEQIPPQIQQQLVQFQQVQQQAQTVGTQKIQMEMQLKEIEKTLEELEKINADSDIYKSVGPLLIKSEKNDVKEELKEKKEVLGLRVKTIQRQEEKILTKLKEMQQKIQDAMKMGHAKAG